MLWFERFWVRTRKRYLKRVPDVIHIGRRAVLRKTERDRQATMDKWFDNTPEGRESFESDVMALKLFGDFKWMVPMVVVGKRRLAMPRYDEKDRLDKAVAQMDEATRLAVAQQAVDILWEIFRRGYAHRDFHAGNLFWINNSLIVTDFETLVGYPEDGVPPFPESYDITGKGLPSPHRTRNMGYCSEQSLSLEQVLKVPVENALVHVRDGLKNELREASLNFKSGGGRHECKAGRIYSSFSLPYFEVRPEEAQRNCSRRLEDFGVDEKTLAGRSLLDLGSNAGGMVFEAQKYSPRRSVGIEYDPEKVRVARWIGRYSGLRNIQFEEGDIDKLTCETAGGPYDVVFCLAVERHVKRPERLYRLLGEMTTDRVYFEGNSGTDVEEVKKQLSRVGFKEIRYLGTSDDDCRPENNVRPLLVAVKR